MPTPLRFQRWLAHQIERNRLTDLALAEQMGVSHVTVGRWKRGTRPRDSQLVRLSEIFGVDVLELYAEMGAVPVRPEDLPSDVREIVRKLLLLTPAQREAFDAMLAAMQGQSTDERPDATRQVVKAAER